MKARGAPKRRVVGTQNDAVKMVGHGARIGVMRFPTRRRRYDLREQNIRSPADRSVLGWVQPRSGCRLVARAPNSGLVAQTGSRRSLTIARRAG
jgi:hypothetical protein